MDINKLVNTPRMYYNPLTDQNSVKGLLDLISKHVKPDMVILELGCFAGVSSELFAGHCRKLFCIDQYIPYAEVPDGSIFEGEKMFDLMQKRYSNITKIKMSSVAASTFFGNGTLDLVYIDAAHDYDNVKKDIQTWLPKVKRNGFISGHDIIIPGVKQAVSELIGDDILTYSDTSWIYQIS
jgi:predicted O-methyltransferase YrrM